ncbi:MAG: DNA-processing protein DprA [Pseudomonadota bacterium]
MSVRPPASRKEEADWLRLIRSENLGPATFMALMTRYGTAGAALSALPDLVASRELRRPIRIASDKVLEAERAAAEHHRVTHVFLGAPGYPERLAAIHAPPPVLCVRGELGQLSNAPLAVVGARRASGGGLTLAKRFADAFGEAGHAVVSGLALGIDRAAHEAALYSGTVAVVAGGVDRPTPEAHIAFADQIVDEGGAVISEMPLGYWPRSRDYPRRNRLIAGLCDAVLVVEAGESSGALHTARYAADENRDVYALPGSVLDPRAIGALRLIREGATMAIDPDDILRNVRTAEPDSAPLLPGFAEDGAGFPDPVDVVELVADALSPTPLSMDELTRAMALPPHAVMAAVMELELDNRCFREANGAVRLP